MDRKINIYEVIRGPIVTEKASHLINKLKKITLEVHPRANKPMIKEALERLFGVRVKDVRTKMRKGKVKTFKRIKSKGKTTKQAIITLKDAQSFDILTQAGTGTLTPGQNVEHESHSTKSNE